MFRVLGGRSVWLTTSSEADAVCLQRARYAQCAASFHGPRLGDAVAVHSWHPSLLFRCLYGFGRGRRHVAGARPRHHDLLPRHRVESGWRVEGDRATDRRAALGRRRCGHHVGWPLGRSRLAAHSGVRPHDGHHAGREKARAVPNAYLPVLHGARPLRRRLERTAAGHDDQPPVRPRHVRQRRRLSDRHRQFRQGALRLLVPRQAGRLADGRHAAAGAKVPEQLGRALARQDAQNRRRVDRRDVPAVGDAQHARGGRRKAHGDRDRAVPREAQRGLVVACLAGDGTTVHLAVPADRLGWRRA